MTDRKPTLEWKKEYSMEVEEIDNQHKKLIGFINELSDATQSGSAHDTCSKIVGELLDYTVYHFSTEEKYFREFNYEDAEPHIKEHEAFKERIGAFKTKVDESNEGDMVELIFEMLDFLEDWLVSHLLHVDKRYVKCFKEHGLK